MRSKRLGFKSIENHSNPTTVCLPVSSITAVVLTTVITRLFEAVSHFSVDTIILKVKVGNQRALYIEPLLGSQRETN